MQCDVIGQGTPLSKACGNRAWGLWGGAALETGWLGLPGRGCIPGLCAVQVPRVPHCRWDGMAKGTEVGCFHPRVSKCVHAAFSPSVREETCTRETHFLLSGAQCGGSEGSGFFILSLTPTHISHAAFDLE